MLRPKQNKQRNYLPKNSMDLVTMKSKFTLKLRPKKRKNLVPKNLRWKNIAILKKKKRKRPRESKIRW